MKRMICTALVVLLLICGIQALAEESLVLNGGFSETDGDLPAHWRKEMWNTDAGISLLGVDGDGSEGNCVCVSNVDENDARFAQTVAVEPDTLYRVSGLIRAEACDTDGYGATLSIGDTFVYSESKFDTGGLWEYVELYGRTDADQTELDLFCRVGGYGQLSRGKAWFDDIEMVAVDDAPDDVLVYDFFRSDSGASASAEPASDEPERFTQAWLLFTCVYVLLVVGLLLKRGRSAFDTAKGNWPAALWIALGAALVVRVIVAACVPGYYTDVNCFTGWSERMFQTGPIAFYAPDYFCDYPPGYMLMLWPVALIRRLLGVGVESTVYRVLLKTLPMLADLAAACLVWRVARRHVSDRMALILSALYALNPAAIANSAAWGQIDGLLTLLVVLCALDAVEYRYVRSLIWFAAALLIKPQALLFAPLGLVAMLTGIISAETPDLRAKRLKDFGIGAACCLGALYAVTFLFCVGQANGLADALVRPVTWAVNQYSGTMQGYRYMTVNTLNLHCLLGLNWEMLETHPVVSALAWALFALAYAGTAALCVYSAKKPRRLLMLGGVLMLLICAFGPMMHERYVFPAMLLLTLAFAVERDLRLLISLVTLTATLFLNEVLVLQGGMTPANYGHLQNSEAWLNNLVSLISILNALFAGWTAADICLRGHVVPLRAAPREAEPAGAYTLKEPANYRLNLKRADYLLMAIVTLAYSVLAFVNLGSTKAPQTGWTSSVSGEQVVFDLGEAQNFRLTYFGGICNSAFTVALSNDGEHWTEDVWAKYNQGEVFRWIWFQPMDEDFNVIFSDGAVPDDGEAHIACATAIESYPYQTARYVRFTAQSAGLILYEAAFLDEQGVPLPVAEVRQYNETAESESTADRLIDEQDTVAARPSYYNSTYFDEIYHARTAYEHLHHLNTYEYTHPPLGKVTMMLGIELFGMTPFGWRFMGALAGVLMLPVMYLLARQLTKDTRLSFIAMCLLALDSMHFTQTRIATIDSYAVFWIMVMYLFMFRYCQMSWNREGLKRTLVPLGLCGVTMGIACATKWIGIYAAVGLAVLFFWTLFVRLRESRYIQGENHTLRNALITLAFCVVFFIVIPLMIYYFSYYWHLRYEGLQRFTGMFSWRWVRRVAEIQKNMFNYHAGLGGDTHYFRSPWYQWPVIWWPMWYYSGAAYVSPETVSSISCMGNPAVWWFGLVAIIYVFVTTCCERRASRKYVMVVIGFASQFLPWVIVPRSTFIYHYFASVPFIILASALLLGEVRRQSKPAFRIASGLLLGAALILFVMFYPLESGMPVAKDYAMHLRWFKWYNF